MKALTTDKDSCRTTQNVGLNPGFKNRRFDFKLHRSMMHQCAACQCFVSVNNITGVASTTAESESGGTPRYYRVAILDGDGYAHAVVSVNTAGTTVIIAPISLSTSLLLPIIALPLTTVYNAVNLLPLFSWIIYAFSFQIGADYKHGIFDIIIILLATIYYASCLM